MQGQRIVTPYHHWYNGKSSEEVVNYHFFHIDKQFVCGDREFVIYERPQVKVVEQPDGTLRFIPDWSTIASRDITAIKGSSTKGLRIRALVERGAPFEEGKAYCANRYQRPDNGRKSWTDQRGSTAGPWRAPADPLDIKVGDRLRRIENPKYVDKDYPVLMTVVERIDAIAAIVQSDNGTQHLAQLYDAYDDGRIQYESHWSLFYGGRLERFYNANL